MRKLDDIKRQLEEVHLPSTEGGKQAFYRSKNAQRIHELIIQGAKAKNPQELDKVLENISGFFRAKDNSITSALLEKSINLHTHIQDILHLPFEFQQSSKAANIISLSLLSKFKKICTEHLNLEQQRGLLKCLTKDGFSVLQQALANGDGKVVAEIIQWLKASLSKEELKPLLKNITRDGFSVLQHALANGNGKVVAEIIQLLKGIHWKIPP